MSTSSPAPPAPAPLQDSSSDSKLMRLSEKAKPLTWLIKVSHKIANTITESYVTGFAIVVKENEVILMTCAHNFDSKGERTIEVRRLEDKRFISNVKIRLLRADWDIAALVVKEVDNGANHVTCAKFGDGSIANCETLLQVGHRAYSTWSVFIGRAAYRCIELCSTDSLKLGKEICGSYVATGVKTTPDYRVIGDMWNKDYFFEIRLRQQMQTFVKNLDALIPVIQCTGLSCSENGCSGGPILNIQGKVVGMMVGEVDGGQIAIHVSLLKKFVELLSATPQDQNEVEEKEKPLDGGHGSKVAKQLKRRDLST